MPVAAAVTLAAMVVLVLAERTRSAVRFGAKPVASAGFVAVALAAGIPDSAYGRWVTVGLVLSWFGDVFLLGGRRSWFLAGLTSFLLAHLAYGAGFAVRGLSGWGAVASAGLAVPAFVVLAWLRPTLPPGMRVPVIAYVAVISLMAATATATVSEAFDGRILGGAFAFYLSDLFVARDRFVAPGWANRLIGLPLYYGAQLLLAWTAGG